MSNEELVVLDEVSGSAQAETIRGLLKSQGINALISQEAAGQGTFPLSVGILGSVEILVRKDDEEKAREILEQYYAGGFVESETEEEDDGGE